MIDYVVMPRTWDVDWTKRGERVRTWSASEGIFLGFGHLIKTINPPPISIARTHGSRHARAAALYSKRLRYSNKDW